MQLQYLDFTCDILEQSNFKQFSYRLQPFGSYGDSSIRDQINNALLPLEHVLDAALSSHASKRQKCYASAEKVSIGWEYTPAGKGPHFMASLTAEGTIKKGTLADLELRLTHLDLSQERLLKVYDAILREYPPCDHLKDRTSRIHSLRNGQTPV